MQLALTFDEAEHAYHLDGARIPSVTQVLSHGQDLSRIPAWTSLRGTAFHLATELDDIGDLDEESVDPLVRPHLEAYRAWKKFRNPHYIHTEFRVWGEIDGLKYAGTIDRVFFRDKSSLPLTVMDLKSGARRKEHGAQLAAYKVAFEQRTGREVDETRGVYCTKDAKWGEGFYPDAEYLEMFRVRLHKYYEEAM